MPELRREGCCEWLWWMAWGKGWLMSAIISQKLTIPVLYLLGQSDLQKYPFSNTKKITLPSLVECCANSLTILYGWKYLVQGLTRFGLRFGSRFTPSLLLEFLRMYFWAFFWLSILLKHAFSLCWVYKCFVLSESILPGRRFGMFKF